ncbi:MAG: (d)CMP kinase [Lachnospiraceae bacterium]|jgi:cytidylate kinase|nr:(d)CMP kinase [Lachnospiraceae bacterium]
MGFQIAIDGPSGAGKSTIAKLVAKERGAIYVDTGAMYRALAIFFIDNGIDGDDKNLVANKVKSANVELKYIDGVQKVILNGEDVTARLRKEEVGNMASKTSSVPEVRKALLELQRDMAKKNDVVMDGRDIGTMVLPNADLKIFLTASSDVRAKRRYDELVEKGETPDFDSIKADIEERDYRDSHREIAPLKKADDAIEIDSSNMSIEEVVDEIVKAIKE